jgi:hypothetical protein
MRANKHIQQHLAQKSNPSRKEPADNLVFLKLQSADQTNRYSKLNSVD